MIDFLKQIQRIPIYLWFLSIGTVLMAGYFFEGLGYEKISFDESKETLALYIGLASICLSVILYVVHLFSARRATHDHHSETKDSIPSLSGKNVVLTGTFELERDALKKILARKGAIVSDQVSSKTDYLLVGTKPGAKKIREARKYKVTTIKNFKI